MSATPRMVTTKELAAHMAVSERTVATWRATGRIPFIKLSHHCVRYNLDEVVRRLTTEASR